MKEFNRDNREFLADGSPNPNFGQVTQVGADDPPPQPNNSNNPYFGKKPLEVHAFYALVGQVLTAARYARLRNDNAFLWVQDMLQSSTFTVVDPDDKAGQFLQLAGKPGADGYLTATAAEDSQPLMTRTERDTIMGAWV